MRSRDEGIVNYLVGWVMKRLPAANPKIVRETVLKALEKRVQETPR